MNREKRAKRCTQRPFVTHIHLDHRVIHVGAVDACDPSIQLDRHHHVEMRGEAPRRAPRPREPHRGSDHAPAQPDGAATANPVTDAHRLRTPDPHAGNDGAPPPAISPENAVEPPTPTNAPPPHAPLPHRPENACTCPHAPDLMTGPTPTPAAPTTPPVLPDLLRLCHRTSTGPPTTHRSNKLPNTKKRTNTRQTDPPMRLQRPHPGPPRPPRLAAHPPPRRPRPLPQTHTPPCPPHHPWHPSPPQ